MGIGTIGRRKGCDVTGCSRSYYTQIVVKTSENSQKAMRVCRFHHDDFYNRGMIIPSNLL